MIIKYIRIKKKININNSFLSLLMYKFKFNRFPALNPARVSFKLYRKTRCNFPM